jgi:hypothetical protein
MTALKTLRGRAWVGSMRAQQALVSFAEVKRLLLGSALVTEVLLNRS